MTWGLPSVPETTTQREVVRSYEAMAERLQDYAFDLMLETDFAGYELFMSWAMWVSRAAESERGEFCGWSAG